MSATDPDQRSLIYTASSSNGLVSLDGASLSFLPPENFNGDVIIDVTVSDGELTDTWKLYSNSCFCK